MEKLLEKEPQLALSQCFSISIQPSFDINKENSPEKELLDIVDGLPVAVADVLKKFMTVFSRLYQRTLLLDLKTIESSLRKELVLFA